MTESTWRFEVPMTREARGMRWARANLQPEVVERMIGVDADNIGRLLDERDEANLACKEANDAYGELQRKYADDNERLVATEKELAQYRQASKIAPDRPNVVWCNGTAVDGDKYVCPTMNENDRLVKNLKTESEARNAAESNLASICDVLNSWAREAGFRENQDYLGFMKIRDHVNDLWGHVNGRQNGRQMKAVEAAETAARLEREMSIRWKEKKDAAERRADRMAKVLLDVRTFVEKSFKVPGVQPDPQKMIAEIEGALKEWD